jgi:hypothetical protein
MAKDEQGFLRRLLFKIAHVVGRTLGELETQLSHEELLEWQAFFILQEEETEKARKEAAKAAKRNK